MKHFSSSFCQCDVGNHKYIYFLFFEGLISKQIYDYNLAFPCCFITRKKHLADNTNPFLSADIFSL